MTKIEQIQSILGVAVDNQWGTESQTALDAAKNEQEQPVAASQSNSWPLEADAAKFYGQSDGSEKWQSENLTTITPPYPLNMDGTPISKVRCHKLIATSLLRCLTKVKEHYGTQAAIAAVGMDKFDGCYNFRPVRGATHLSMHAYGAAVDFDAAHNPLGSNVGSMPAEVVAIFKAEGCRWGGDYNGRKDKMHYEWCR